MCSVLPYMQTILQARLIHPSAWKGYSAKFEHLLGPHFIHILASLCATTTSGVDSYASRRREWLVAPG
jgi:hypothetical protein